MFTSGHNSCLKIIPEKSYVHSDTGVGHNLFLT